MLYKRVLRLLLDNGGSSVWLLDARFLMIVSGTSSLFHGVESTPSPGILMLVWLNQIGFPQAGNVKCVEPKSSRMPPRLTEST
jgi:hypothetical protein